MLTAEQSKQLQQAVDMLHAADVLIQLAMGHSEECYYIHTQVENAADDVLEYIQEQLEGAVND